MDNADEKEAHFQKRKWESQDENGKYEAQSGKVREM